MASAQTEPSMDEILASIRRIISEEDEAPAEVPVRQRLETLQLRSTDEADAGEDEPEAEAPKPRLRATPAEPKAEPEADAADEPEAEAGSDHVTEAGAQANGEATDDLDDFEPLPEEPVAGVATMEPAAEAHDHGEVQDDTFDANEGASEVEPILQAQAAAMPQAATQAVADAVRPRVLAEASRHVSDSAAGQAASAFGALEENMRLSAGSGRTIEDLIEAMLAPMLTAWLDENLPRIVEDKVEEEVRRISRRR